MAEISSDQTLVDYCYKRLKEGIIRGEFAPGEKLRIETLKAHLGTGPTPIREALSRLTSSGLIDTSANRGFFVRQVSEAEVRDIYATFNKIELLALEQSIELGNTDWEATILASLHRLAAVEKAPSPVDSTEWLIRNYEFHYSLIAACNSPCLLKIREDIYQLFDRYCHLSALLNKNVLFINHNDHCEMAKAVIERDKKKACTLTTLHLEKSLDFVIKKLQRRGPSDD